MEEYEKHEADSRIRVVTYGYFQNKTNAPAIGKAWKRGVQGRHEGRARIGAVRMSQTR